MDLVVRPLLFLTIAATCLSAFADESMHALEKQGTLLRLSGDFVSAKMVENELIDRYPQPAGHVFALNSIITHLTWDETQTKYDDELIEHAARTLEWCEPRIDDEEVGTTANYYCGQANFILAYHHGLRGNYYQAGRRGTASIDYLETALARDPSLIDAKMHLGVGYYVADNLPPFVKMFSKILWFIPSGNSERSLPYLLDVIEDGDQYRDVARYIYSILLLETPELRPEASIHLQRLVSLYPANPRFQLRFISLLISMNDYEGPLRTIFDYLDSDKRPVEPDLSLAKIWKVRAYLGRGQTELAGSTFSEIDPVFRNARDELPGWSVAWYILTDGQLHDLANRRDQALAAYKEILSIAKYTYVNVVILDAARSGLSKPYRLHTGQ
jgi:tetratricopeptide (TPR) repeat protein